DRQQQTCRPIGAPAAGSAAAGHRDLISASHDQSVGRWYFPATCWRGCPRVPVATPGAPAGGARVSTTLPPDALPLPRPEGLDRRVANTPAPCPAGRGDIAPSPGYQESP